MTDVTKPLRPGDLDPLARSGTGRSVSARSAMPDAGGASDLDVAALDERLGGDHELLSELVDLLRSTLPDLLARIDDCLAAHDLGGVREAAHALSGAIGNFCAPAAGRSATALLAAARRGDRSEAVRARGEFAASWQRLEPLLVELVTPRRG